MYEDIVATKKYRWDERCCSHCKYSEYDETHPNIVPSIHICHNKESEGYGPQPWSWVCDKFEPIGE